MCYMLPQSCKCPSLVPQLCYSFNLEWLDTHAHTRTRHSHACVYIYIYMNIYTKCTYHTAMRACYDCA